MGSFWARHNVARAANSVFSSMVRNAALSGLECLVLSDAEYASLDSIVVKFARKALRGAACLKTQSDDGSWKYSALPDKDVYKLTRLVPAKLELCVRRLQYWQSVARNPPLHRTVLATVFGRLSFDDADTVLPDGSLHPQANPWAKQLESDLQQLLELDSASELLAGIGNRPFLLFTSYRPFFVQIDCGELRAQFFGVCIPPPGYLDVSNQVDAGASVDLPAELPFSCTCFNNDGSACSARFVSEQALAMHIRRTCGGTHGHIHDHVKAAVCNQCPWCKKIFASIRVAQNHIKSRLSKGYCTGSGSSFTTVVELPGCLDCPFCSKENASLPDLLACIVAHFP